MPIDKSWCASNKRNREEFDKGLESFMKIAKNHLNEEGLLRCPCRKCLNMYFHLPDTVEGHIHARGFQRSYTQWIYHGEPPPPRVVNEVAPSIDEMFDVIDDLIGKQNSNNAVVDEGGNGVDQEFDELFEEMEKELFPGCTWLSSLNFLAKLLHLKAMNKWTDSSFDQLLEFLKFAFPKENRIPTSHYEAKKKMRKIGLGYQTIHVCKNDCCLFWKENESKHTCPICGDSKWYNDKTTGKKVPHKVLRYFPLTSRLKSKYSSRHTAKDMIWHKTGRSEEGIMRHPVDGTAWKEFDTKYPEFAKEPRNVRLGLAADGFNPFGNMSLSYSMWPVILTTYNTPPWICMKESSFFLTLLIPGPRSPGKDMDVFLRPLVNELKMLWDEGVQTRDASTSTVFTMRAALLWTINDFPARSSLSGWSGQGYLACSTCNEDTPSCRVIGKTAYVGHRCFLPTGQRWRKSDLFDGQHEKRPRPKPLTTATILRQLAYVPILTPGKHSSHGGVKRKRDSKELNWTKRSIFYELEYWSSLRLKHNLDVMHIEKNVCDSLLGTFLMNDKSKDTLNARKDLKNLGIRKELWLQQKDNKIIKPHPIYSFTPENRRRFCQFIKRVKLPDGFGSNFKKKVTENDTNITGLKSHDSHILMQRLLPIGVRGYLDKDILATIGEFCTFFKQLCARTLVVEDMRKAQKELISILCKLEMIFPPAFFDIMVHVVLHFPEEAILGGPVYMRWMYPFERYMKNLKIYVRNKAKPEVKVPDEQKSLILPRIESYFDLQSTAPDHGEILASIDRQCADRYSDSKSKYKEYFDLYGGYDNIENARRNPEPRLTPATWNKLIDDVFLHPEWKKKSIRNKRNREKLKYPSFHGTSSYVNSRYNKMNPETKEVPGIVENWHHMHYKEGRGWANEEARLTYERLTDEWATQSSSCSSVNEQEIAAKVFGERRGHNIGRALKLKNTSIRSYFPSSSSATSSQPPPTNEQVKETVRENNKKINRKWKNRFQNWIASVSEKNPNLQVPPLDGDDDEDEDEDVEDENDDE